MSRPFTIIGHRGAAGHAPENTLLGLETGIRLGAPWIEFDVQKHGDALLLFHDDRLERTTNGSGWLLDQPLDYVRGLDAGKGERIPTLAEALDRIDRRVCVNVELKTADGTAAQVAGVLRHYVAARGWAPEQFLVSSFILPELREFRRAAPEIPVGALLCGVPLDLAACATELGAKSINLSGEFAPPALVADAHRRGLAVNVYTVNRPDDMRRLRSLGVDGIFTDFPDRGLALG